MKMFVQTILQIFSTLSTTTNMYVPTSTLSTSLFLCKYLSCIHFSHHVTNSNHWIPVQCLLLIFPFISSFPKQQMAGENLPLCSKSFDSPLLVTVGYLIKVPVYMTSFTHWQFCTNLLVLLVSTNYLFFQAWFFQFYVTTDIMDTLGILIFIGPSPN